jgi:UDP-N-acetylglucosamine--N-acetylmuramyl-(pentapeptide) pyrophosphoryl-undecaprenol N-acetylglucosamine transferase
MCKSVTTSYEYNSPPFTGVKSDRFPTPCRFAGRTPLAKEDACRSFELDPSRPVIFVLGGGTGSKAINDAIGHIQKELVALTQIIHLTGKGRSTLSSPLGQGGVRGGSITKEFFNEDEMFRAFCAADLVISRAGIGTISEVACLSKPAILIPIPKSHQEKNAAKLPCDVITQNEGFHDRLLSRIRFYLSNEQERRTIGEKIHESFPVDDGSALAERWLHLCG